MKLRWFSVCDKIGKKSEPTLQFWDDIFECWREIIYVECKLSEEQEYINMMPMMKN